MTLYIYRKLCGSRILLEDHCLLLECLNLSTLLKLHMDPTKFSYSPVVMHVPIEAHQSHQSVCNEQINGNNKQCMVQTYYTDSPNSFW
jgi:hypothetical protein